MRPKYKLQKALSRYQRIPEAKPGLMGNGRGVVDVPNRPGYVYVRIANSPPEVVINKRCASIDNQKVWIGYDPTEPNVRQVLSTRSFLLDEDARLIQAPQVGTHGATHGMYSRDTIYLDQRQFLPFRPAVNGTMRVWVNRGISFLSGTWGEVPAQSIDLTPYVPTTGALYSLLYINSNKQLTINVGTLRDLNTLRFSDTPAPSSGTLPIAAVRLWAGISGLYETYVSTDISDVRLLWLYP